jgi:hypothetical protein
VRSTVGISLLGLGSSNAANNLPDLVVGLAALDLKPNIFCLTWAVVGFPACTTHDELVIQSLFTYRGICVKLYLFTAVWFPLGDGQVCIEGARVVLLLLVEAGCICNIKKEKEITHICNKNVSDTYTNNSICMSLFGLEIGCAGADDCVGCESSGTR